MYDDGGGGGRGGGDDDDDDDDITTSRHKTLHFTSNALNFCVKEVAHYPSTMFRSASTSARLKLQAFTAASARMHSTVTLLGGSREAGN